MDLNRVLYAGRLTRDPELKELPGGTSVCEFGIACNRTWKDQQTNEKREDVCFIDAKGFGKIAGPLHEFFQKGKGILVEGSLRQERWEKEGQKHSKHVLVIDRFHFVDPPPARDEGRRQDGAMPTVADVANEEANAAGSGAGRGGSSVARRRREKSLAAAGAGVDPAQLPF